MCYVILGLLFFTKRVCFTLSFGLGREDLQTPSDSLGHVLGLLRAELALAKMSRLFEV